MVVILAAGGFCEQNILGNIIIENLVLGSVFSKFLVPYSLILSIILYAWTEGVWI